MNTHAQSAPELSFEFFPPSSTEATLRLWRAVERLAPLSPRFVSVTYGAGGSTRDRTIAAITTIRDRARLSVAGHLTCVGASRDETLAVAEKYRAMGATRIVALRGDPPKGAGPFRAHPEGFGSALELVSALADRGGFDISVACYPETHPEAASPEADIQALKAKEAAGATRAISQFFFETDTFLRFRDRARSAGVTMPIVPGILPIENFPKMARFAKSCGAHVPDWMEKAFANAADEAEAELLATSIAADQCAELMDQGAEHIHLYTLNNPDLTYNVCRAIGVEPSGLSLAEAAGAA